MFVFPLPRYSAGMRNIVVILCIAALSVGASAGKKKPNSAPLLARPNQTVEITGLQVPTPAQKCENWGWAAGLEMMLRLQGVRNFDQRYWITKLTGGELCLDQLESLEELAQLIDGEYVIGVNQKVQLKTRYLNGAPQVLDDLIVALRRGEPSQFFWNGRAYVVVGITYDEYIAPNNARIFMVKEIKLLDPLASEDSTERYLSFVRERDSAGDVAGMMSVQATPVQ